MRMFRLALSTLLVLTSVGCAPLMPSQKVESSVCGSIKEPLVFSVWNRVAGEPDPQRAAGIPNAAPITHRTKDGRLLRGYKLSSTAQPAVGTVLVAQGNAMLSDRLLSSLQGFSAAGLEVFIFDYRGYGSSEGRRRLKAMISDYREISRHIAASSSGKLFLYGISFGGIVTLNVVGSGAEYDRVVIDSTPSRISHLGCPEQYDPIVNLPSDASKLLLVAGERDGVVRIEDSLDLVNRARALGARTEVRSDYAHPFMDPDPAVRESRMALIRAFFLD